jgi:DNA modification methylase
MNTDLIWGDCLSHLLTLTAGSYDSVVTDPPYGIDYSTGWGSTDWEDGAIDGDVSCLVRDEMLKLIGDVPALVFGSWKIKRPTGTRMLLVWDAQGALGMGDLKLPWKPSHQEIYVLGNRNGFQGRRDSDVLSYHPVQAMAKNGRLHPMEKPIDLMIGLIKKLKTLTVLDPFMGSGTTGVACVKLGINFIGIEKDEKYFNIASKRISQAKSQMVLDI